MELFTLETIFYYDIDYIFEGDDRVFNETGIVSAEDMTAAFGKIQDDFGEEYIHRINKLECINRDTTHTLSLKEMLRYFSENGCVSSEGKDEDIVENMEAEIKDMRGGELALREYICQLEKKIENLTADNKVYQAEYFEVCTTVDELRYDLDGAYTELGKKDEEIRKLKAEIERLKTNSDFREIENCEYFGRIIARDRAIEELKAENERLENRLDFCEEQRKDFGEACNELEIKVDSLTQKNARLTLENDSLKEEIEFYEKEKKNLSAAVNRLSGEKQGLKDYIATLEYEINHYLPDEMVSKDEHDIMMKELANVQSRCDKLEIENETISSDYENVEEELACTEDDLCEAREEITRLEEQIDTLKKDNKGLEDKLIATEEERNEAKDWNVVLDKELNGLNAEYAELENDYNHLGEDYDWLEGVYKDLTKQHLDLKKYAEGLEAELETRKRHERQLSKELADEKQKAFGKAVPCGTWNVKFEEGDSNDGT